MKMYCPLTKKEEEQDTIKEAEEWIRLKCHGCGQTITYEIGEVFGG